MNDKQKEIIETLKTKGMATMASHVEAEFNKGFTFDEVWAGIQAVNEEFHDVAWKTHYGSKVKDSGV